MKKVNLSEQLDLSQEIIANLNDEQLQEVEGGQADGIEISCIFSKTSCPKTSLEEEAV